VRSRYEREQVRLSLLAGRTGVVSLGYEEEAVDPFTGSVAFGLQ